MQPARVGVIREYERALFDGVDNGAGDGRPERGAAVAAAKPSYGPELRVTDIRRAVHDDGALARAIVDAGLEPIEAQRISIGADVSVCRTEKTQTRLMAAVVVREPRGEVFTAATAVGDELFEEHLFTNEIEDPEPRLAGRARIIDDR